VETLILIPGLLCNRELWSSQILALADCAEIVVPEITSQTTISEIACDILDQAPAHFSLVGFSLGSQVALEIMQVARERIDRLALLSATHGGVLPPVEAAIRKAIVLIEQGGFAEYLEAAYPTYVTPAHAQEQALKQRFMDMANAVGPEAGVRQMKALLALDAPFQNLNRISCPTIVVGGSEDQRTTPAAHAALAREIPCSLLVMIAEAAHFTPFEQPAQVTQAFEQWISRS
jgi:pimeloyl-ACP methyl ester carboxylesterase